MTAAATLDRLKRLRPEWDPWLTVVEEVVRESAAPAWDAAVSPVAPGQIPNAPLLAGAALSLDPRAVRHLLECLVRRASRSGAPKLATLHALNGRADVLALFAASLCQDTSSVKDVADASGADAEALQAVVALLCVPFLQACHRRWASSISESWLAGYCPVCASWPAFAEVRGIERSHCLRCGRCGAAWPARSLQCPYCALSDHTELVALVPEKDGSHGVIGACARCRGYVKTFTTLQGCAPGAVMLEDLASVHLDIAALEQGYARPSGAGYPLEATVAGIEDWRRFFAWN